jgi:hypothetical protein
MPKVSLAIVEHSAHKEGCGMTDLERCHAEQAECRDYIVGRKGDDMRGAIAGLEDWTAEEVLLMAEDSREQYREFLRRKLIVAQHAGIQPTDVNPMLFPFQADIVRWALRRGRAAIFADCGLGKTPIQLEWARQVHDHTGKPVLIFAPLAVSQQTIREGAKFHIPVVRCDTANDLSSGINITNYERLHHFADPTIFGGIVLDESSILKGFDGKFRRSITDFARTIPFRLACTATPAPNDHMELGNHAEFLEIMRLPEMLATFFIHDGGDTAKWRLKGHAESVFWRWVASWAVCLRKPSDLGYDDAGFDLPPLRMHQHTVQSEITSGFLFPMEGNTLSERNGARRDSIADRVAECAAIVNSSEGRVDCMVQPERRIESAGGFYPGIG